MSLRIKIIMSLSTSSILTGCFSNHLHSYSQGRDWLEEARQEETLSKGKIFDASNLRKQIAILHREKNAATDGERATALENQIAELGQQMTKLQEDGAALRVAAVNSQENALALFSAGLQNQFKDWIQVTGPMQMAGTVSPFIGHNTRIASADPNIRARESRIAAAVDDVAPADTELISILKGQEAPTDLNTSSFSLSRQKQWIAHIEVFPDDRWGTKVPINEIHRWLLVVSDADGQPVEEEFNVVGHMPGHVHGLPTAPKVTQKLAPGVYLVEGVKFQMRGWWVMQFETKDDSIRFNIVL